MKRTLEVLLAAAALVIAGFLTVRYVSRPTPTASSAAGRDQEDPSIPAGAPYAPAVSGVPMIKLDHPPRPRPIKAEIPAPAVTP